MISHIMPTPTEQELRLRLLEAADKVLNLDNQIVSLLKKKMEAQEAFRSAYEQLEAMGVHPLFPSAPEEIQPADTKPIEAKP